MNNILLKDIAITQTGPFGSQLHEKDYVDKGTPIVTVEHLGEAGFSRQNLPQVSDSDKYRLSKYLLKEGDIVFSRVGSIDRNTYVSKDEEGWLFSGRCLRVRVNKLKADPKFISYYFRQKNFKKMMLDISVGATMPSLNTTLMDGIPLKIPHILQQKKIAAVLSILDKKIELNSKINSKLETMAKLIYDYWFVQFDFPDENGKPYKSSGGKMVWSEELKREIPEGWEVKDLSRLASINRGNLITEKTANTSGNIKVVAAGIDYSYTHDESNYEENTITVSSSGANAGYMNLWREPIYASDCITLRGSSDTGTFYVWGYLNLVKEHILGQARGSAQPHVYPSDLERLLWVEPNKHVLAQFGNLVIPINKRISIIQKENQQLGKLRDWLLPMLMNGQVKIKG